MRSCYKWQYSSFLMKKGSWLDDKHPSLPTQGVTKWTKGAGVRLWVWVRSVWLYNLNFHKVIMLKWILKTNLRKILCIFFFLMMRILTVIQDYINFPCTQITILTNWNLYSVVHIVFFIHSIKKIWNQIFYNVCVWHQCTYLYDLPKLFFVDLIITNIHFCLISDFRCLGNNLCDNFDMN